VDKKTRPLSFSSQMVVAILAGDKTQTRRLSKPKLGIGDTFYIKETLYNEGGTIAYFADKKNIIDIIDVLPKNQNPCDWRWSADFLPSMFMPKIYARIFGEVVNLRQEQLLDINEADARAESFEFRQDFLNYFYKRNPDHGIDGTESENPKVWVIEFVKL